MACRRKTRLKKYRDDIDPLKSLANEMFIETSTGFTCVSATLIRATALTAS